MKNFYPILLCIALFGCNEKYHTQSEFLHNPELLESTLKMCRQDPAKAQKDDNCINAFSAYNTKLTMRQFGGGCFKNGVDHACLEKEGFQQK